MQSINHLLVGLDVDRLLVEERIKGLSLHDAAQAVAYIVDNPDYQLLAGRFEYSHIEDQIVKPYSKALLNDQFDKIIDPNLVRFVMKHASVIDGIIEEDDYSHLRYSWISIRTLELGYMKKFRDTPLEDVRYAIMRMALHIFKDAPEPIVNIRKFYQYVSQGYFSPASPTWFHAGTKHPQMKSCFLTRIEDNIESIMQAYNDTALISKEGGGNGVHISGLRHSTVRSTGKSGGVVPWMRMWNEQARAIDQGGHRKGAFTFFLSSWHKDIPEFADLRLLEGNQDFRTPHLNICVWNQDLFFKRVLEDGMWSLFCPNEAKGLNGLWGVEFERLYLQYENSDIPRVRIPAKQLMAQLCANAIQTGEPFMMAGDACNRKSNQQHDCVHEGSNLCLEIIEKASDSQIAACNLANLCLPKFVRNNAGFDFRKFAEVTRFIVRVLNHVTETNFYPVSRIKHSDDLHSPIGIGVQGFANAMAKLDIAWVDEDGAPTKRGLNLKEEIWACKYFHSLSESCKIARERGRPYATFRGSPLSQGKLQWDLWYDEYIEMTSWDLPGFEVMDDIRTRPRVDPSRWGESDLEWETLIKDVKKYGTANSLLNADMPTASTAHIQGNMESFEPNTYNLYTRRVLAGDCYVFNRDFFNDLKELGLFDTEVIGFIMENNGSVQGLTEFLERKHQYFQPKMHKRLKYLERKYLTAFEISMMTQSDYAAVSGPYVCQSTSFNFHKRNASVVDIFNILMYRWMQGHKTLMYYLRTEAAVDAMKYTVRTNDTSDTDNDVDTTEITEAKQNVKCEGDVCMMCE